jgi:hypothetical protein
VVDLPDAVLGRLDQREYGRRIDIQRWAFGIEEIADIAASHGVHHLSDEGVMAMLGSLSALLEQPNELTLGPG